MGYIHCCSGLRRTRTYFVVPENGFSMCRIDYLEECPVCGHKVIQLTRKSEDNKVSIVRKVNQKAVKFFNKVKRLILYEQDDFMPYSLKRAANGPVYSEFGKKRFCSSNFSTLKIGKYENKDLRFVDNIILK